MKPTKGKCGKLTGSFNSRHVKEEQRTLAMQRCQKPQEKTAVGWQRVSSSSGRMLSIRSHGFVTAPDIEVMSHRVLLIFYGPLFRW